MEIDPEEEVSLAPYRLVAETEHFVLIDKAPEINFHTEASQLGVAEQLKQDLGLELLYPLHRLDKMTSGLLLFGKELKFAHCLNDQFKNHQIEKYYLALSNNKPKKKQGLILGDMVKARRGSWKLQSSLADPAKTLFFSRSVAPGQRLFILRPITGRTHQLRVAMKSLGSPILGDLRYGGNDADRGYLHAYALAFQWQGQRFEFICEPQIGEQFAGEDIAQAVAELSPPWQLRWPKR
ncbi:MAG: TIGR01621 family pseudouridine synthase [Motiliproteus sp.]|nr:TIGR01621 family pseudouridine synthase [Motiliproteus sp.]MCW9052559.1 TIGR01621 family pseudouridine synthase [Motiliproteus sp.]